MKKDQKTGNNGKISVKDFVHRAIRNLRSDGYMGIHTRFSGFNQAFRKQFDKDPVAATKKLAASGDIEMRYCTGGAVIYLPGEKPVTADQGDEALAKIMAD